MTKVYEMTRFDGMQLSVCWCGKTLHMEFRGGDARHRARYQTSNPFVQDALEHDPRFGSLFVLSRQYDSEVKEEVTAKEAERPVKRVTNVKTVNQALRWLAENGFNPTGESDLAELTEKAGVVFPNLKK